MCFIKVIFVFTINYSFIEYKVEKESGILNNKKMQQ